MKQFIKAFSGKVNFQIFLVLLFCGHFASAQDNQLWYVSFRDANLRPTYDTFHHIREAQQKATGKGIKIGILDRFFGMQSHQEFYCGGKNFTGNVKAFEELAEHGFWIAVTLKEIAPDVEIYALNALDRDRDLETRSIVEAIDWAIENGIDILTYSSGKFRQNDREVIDRAVRKAIDNNIVTTFIHYDLEENFLPNAFFSQSPYSRECDVNIFHLDYNVIFIDDYINLKNNDYKPLQKLDDNPFVSYSSMSVVLAGIVAMLKEVSPGLTPAEIKKILVESSEERVYEGEYLKHVVNAANALKYLETYTTGNP